MDRPRIVVTLANSLARPHSDVAALKNRRYLEALERAGADPLPLDERAAPDARAAAFAAMDGLLMSGGADIDPARYGESADGARDVEPGRDALEDEAFRAAYDAGVPVLGICRGLQAINVFAGGSLVQHLEGHESMSYPSPAVTRHRLDLSAGSRLELILDGSANLEVNSYHHQAITPDRLAPGLRISATAAHPGIGELVEAVETTDPDRWLIGVQCHPERTESSPPVFERLWSEFVAACAKRAADRDAARVGTSAGLCLLRTRSAIVSSSAWPSLSSAWASRYGPFTGGWRNAACDQLPPRLNRSAARRSGRCT